MNKKIWMLILVLIVFGVVIFLYGFPDFGGTKKLVTDVSKKDELFVSSNASSVASSVHAKKHKIVTGIDQQDNQSKHLDDYEVYKVEEWMSEHGYFDAEAFAEYSTYDEETLQKLALEGDIKALHLFAIEKLKKGESEIAFATNLDAAIYGSTRALSIASDMLLGKYDSQKDPVLKERLLVDPFAFLEVAKKRGDVQVTDRNVQSIKQVYGIEIDAIQAEAIQRRGDEMYNSLNDARIDQNLGDFDNSISDDIIKFQSAIN